MLYPAELSGLGSGFRIGVSYWFNLRSSIYPDCLGSLSGVGVHYLYLHSAAATNSVAVNDDSFVLTPQVHLVTHFGNSFVRDIFGGSGGDRTHD